MESFSGAAAFRAADTPEMFDRSKKVLGLKERYDGQ